MIEDALGKPVVVFAPPGGRYNQRVIDVALALGYQRLAVSRPGLWNVFSDITIPRFPIYAQTSVQTVASYHRPLSKDTLVAVARYGLVKSGQNLLGNERYDQLRNAVLGGGLMTLAYLTFFSSVLLLAYIFAGYPLLIWILAKWRKRPSLRDEAFRPSVEAVVIAHNEGKTIAKKIDNLFVAHLPPSSPFGSGGLRCVG